MTLCFQALVTPTQVVLQISKSDADEQNQLCSLTSWRRGCEIVIKHPSWQLAKEQFSGNQRPSLETAEALWPPERLRKPPSLPLRTPRKKRLRVSKVFRTPLWMEDRSACSFEQRNFKRRGLLASSDRAVRGSRLASDLFFKISAIANWMCEAQGLKVLLRLPNYLRRRIAFSGLRLKLVIW